MELRNFIKNTVIDYLNESILFENSQPLSFPIDFIKRQSRVQYLYQMGAMRPNGVDDDWYESKKTIIKKYKGIPVKMKQLKNIDGSDRGYGILQVGNDDDVIKINNRIPSSNEVRSAIDAHYDKFISMMDKINVTDTELEDLISQKGILSKTIYDADGLYETAIRWLVNNRFNRLEKRKILKSLMNKGLSIEEAISFFSQIN